MLNAHLSVMYPLDLGTSFLDEQDATVAGWIFATDVYVPIPCPHFDLVVAEGQQHIVDMCHEKSIEFDSSLLLWDCHTHLDVNPELN